MNFISYAQNFEDVMLRRALKNVEKGFYIDVGANDPIDYSVTKAFYDLGWCGINIEPVAEWFQKLQRERPKDINLQIAASDSKGELRFFEVQGTGLSTTDPEYAKRHARENGYAVIEYSVPTRTLTDICLQQCVSEVHFLKIDVEGCEFSVLNGLDFSIIRPWIVLVESTLPGLQIEDYEGWEPLLLNHGYHYVYFDGLNRYYVADEHPELDASFSVPPNVWDRFEPFEVHKLGMQCQQLKGVLNEREDQRQQLESALHSLMNSRSWRITVPLRMTGKLVRYFRQRYLQLIAKVQK